MPKVKPKDVSDAVAKCQQSNIYHLARRSRIQAPSQVELRKLCSALANQSEPFGWTLTSSCKVFPVITGGVIVGWRICLIKRKGERSKVRGQEKKSKVFASQIAAENAMYEFRKNVESPRSKKKLDQWEQSLVLVSSLPVELVELIAGDTTTNSKKKPPVCSSRHQKRIAMSSNSQLHQRY
jgi:hypothetical protein